MGKRTKLRLFGGIVLLFNIWLIGRYDLTGAPTILLTFGFALGYELLVVRPASIDDAQRVGRKHQHGQALLWAAIGAILSLFMAHPPANHLDPVDRFADRAVAMIVWAILGAIAFLVISFFRRPPAEATTATMVEERQPIVGGQQLAQFKVKPTRPKPKDVRDLQGYVSGQGKTGISLSIEDGRTIVGLAIGSPAQLAGLAVGDQIIAIDGQLCSTDYKANVLHLVGSQGTDVRVTVWRNEASQDYDLTRVQSPLQVHASPEPTEAPLSQTEEVLQLGITKDGDQFRYQAYLYDKIEDAIAFARIDRSRAFRCK